MSKHETLQRMANTPITDLVARDASGERQLFYHYQACCNSKLIGTPSALDDIARLHALFDVALAHGLPTLIVDYIVEVCSDPFFKSSDEREAYLLDGECVASWCLTSLQQSSSRIHSALSAGLQNSLAIVGESARLNGLIGVIRALSSSSPSGMSSGPNQEDAMRLRQTVQVMEWGIQQKLHTTASSCGRFSSAQEWKLAVNTRRDASQPNSTFLQDILAELRSSHGLEQGLQYPPASFEKVIQALFLNGSASESSWRLKLTLLLYYLLDVGHKALLNSFGQCFGISGGDLVQLHAQFLLDEAALEQPGSLALETACSILPEGAPQDLPFKFVEVLAARGRPKVALQLLRTRARGSRADPDEALHEALMAVGILLDSNLVTEAYIQVRQHVAGSVEERVLHDTRALVYRLASWAADNSAMGRVLQLPLMGMEEQALLEWLEDSLSKGDPQGDFLVLFFLLRQRLPEAMHSFSRLSSAKGVSPQTADLRTVLKEMLAAGARLLPDVQKGLTLHPVGDQPILRASAEDFGARGQLGVFIGAKLGTQPLFHVCGSSAAPPPLFTPLVDNVGAAPAFGEEEPVEEEPAMRLMSHHPPNSNSILGGAERREEGVLFAAPAKFGAGFSRPQPPQDEIEVEIEEGWDTLMDVAGVKRGQTQQPAKQQRQRRR